MKFIALFSGIFCFSFTFQAFAAGLSNTYLVDVGPVLSTTGTAIDLYDLDLNKGTSNRILSRLLKLQTPTKQVVLSFTPEPTLFILDKDGVLSWVQKNKEAIGIRSGVSCISEAPDGVLVSDLNNQIVLLKFNPLNSLGMDLNLVATLNWGNVAVRGVFEQIQLVAPDEFVVVSKKELIHAKGFQINTNNDPQILSNLDLESILFNQRNKNITFLDIYGLMSRGDAAWIHAKVQKIVHGFISIESEILTFDLKTKNLDDYFSSVQSTQLLNMNLDPKSELTFVEPNGHYSTVKAGAGVQNLAMDVFSRTELIKMGVSFPAHLSNGNADAFFIQKKDPHYWFGTSSQKNSNMTSIKVIPKKTTLELMHEMILKLKPSLKLTTRLFCELVNVESYEIYKALIDYDFDSAVLKKYGLRKVGLRMEAIPGMEDLPFTSQNLLANEIDTFLCQKALIPNHSKP